MVRYLRAGYGRRPVVARHRYENHAVLRRVLWFQNHLAPQPNKNANVLIRVHEHVTILARLYPVIVSIDEEF
jgi:hypothetical protein